MTMQQTTQFYYVQGGEIAKPVDVWTGTRKVTSNPFYRPTRVGDTLIGANSDDIFLVELGVYRLWVDAPPSPGEHYRLVQGPLIVTADRVERRDTWEPRSAEELRASHADAATSQVRVFSEAELVEDSARKWQTDLDLRNRDAVLSALAETGDDDLVTFDSNFAAHPISEAQYAANLLRQEVDILLYDTELTGANAEPILDPVEREAMKLRVQTNRETERGLRAQSEVPKTGVARGLVTLAEEATEEATFREVLFDWSGSDYHIPEIRLASMPNGVVVAQVFAMVYDADNVYRSWMPFEQQPDGSWRTPGGTSYIAIAKPESSSWRVAIAYMGTSADYEITQRVSLVPPTISRSIVRWGGRGV